MKITIKHNDKEMIYEGDNMTEVRYHLSNIESLITTMTNNLIKL